jgi:uncharacterized protein YciI
MHYVLLYEAADDYVARRTPYREAHLHKVQDANRRGEIVLAGALADPADGAMLVFRNPAAAERFAKSDPYVLNGVVRSWKLRQWTTVIGDGASMPVLEGNAPPVEASGRPEPSECPYDSGYSVLVEGGDIVRALSAQQADALALLRSLDEDAGNSSYAPGKWTIKQVLGHMTDAERIYSYRSLCFARGDGAPLRAFDQDQYMPYSDFNSRPLVELIEEFRAVREATLGLYRGLSAEAWLRRGTVGDQSATVRGVAYVCAGHERHHVKILRERYLA